MIKRLAHVMIALPALSALVAQTAQAADSAEVLFTNPTCTAKQFTSYRAPEDTRRMITLADGTSVYEKRSNTFETQVDPALGIPTIGGGYRKQIAANLHCDSGDKRMSTTPASQSPFREYDSPYLRVTEWLDSVKSGDSIFVASMSFSDSTVARKLCDAAKNDVSVKVFIQEPSYSSGAFNSLKYCSSPVDLVTYPRGKGRLAHMKTIVIDYNNPAHEEKLGQSLISFQSGNISSGLWAHHENWVFVEKSQDDWFAKDHHCLRDSIDEESVLNLGTLYAKVDECRSAAGIDSARQQDQSVTNYFIPLYSNRGYNDRNALRDDLIREVYRADHIRIAAHHLTDSTLLNVISTRLQRREVTVELLLDDEIYWANRTSSEQGTITDTQGRQYFQASDYANYCNWGEKREDIDRSCSLFASFEYSLLESKLISKGASVKFVESNHLGRKLFHNKFIIFNYGRDIDGFQGAVFTGAGNLSKAGFRSNFENYYMLRMPSILARYNEQFDDFNNRAVIEADLPITWDYEVRDLDYERIPVTEDDSGSDNDSAEDNNSEDEAGDDDISEDEGAGDDASEENSSDDESTNDSSNDDSASDDVNEDEANNDNSAEDDTISFDIETIQAGVQYRVAVQGDSVPSNSSAFKSLLKTVLPKYSSVYKLTYSAAAGEASIEFKSKLDLSVTDFVNALNAVDASWTVSSLARSN